MGIIKDPQIVLEDVSLDLPIYGLSNRILKKEIIRFMTGGIFRRNKKQVIVRALDSISMTINSSMRLGLIGHNGSGKSTFLRLVSGIYTPTSGSLKVVGKVSPLLDLMCGIDLDISGKENMISRGMMMGYSKQKMLLNLGRLIEMTGLGGFIDMPVRSYSAGMQVRLAFSVSVLFHPEILVIDEIFGVGDANFSQQSEYKIKELITQSKIFILASHNEPQIQKYCTHVLWLDKGRVRFFGDCLEGLSLYKNRLN